MNISKISIWSLLLMLSMTLVACSDDDEAPKDKISASARGTFTDPRDGNEYQWVRYGNLDWMAENFRYDLKDDVNCMVYLDKNDNPIDEKTYGRIYSYSGAEAACPEGWRLPTDDDWKNLETTLGMSASDANKTDERGKIASRMLTRYDETCDLNLRLGGYNDPWRAMGSTGCLYWGVYGFYWTASKDNEQGKGDKFYWYRKFVFNSNGIIRQSTTPEMLFSVRYVRDAQ